MDGWMNDRLVDWEKWGRKEGRKEGLNKLAYRWTNEQFIIAIILVSSHIFAYYVYIMRDYGFLCSLEIKGRWKDYHSLNYGILTYKRSYSVNI